MRAHSFCLITIATTLSPPALAQDSSVVIDRKDIPAVVAKQVDCGMEPETISRRPFAGGFVFSWQCPGNNANWMTALVYATREDGEGARLIRFPTPRRGNWLDEAANAEFFPRTREITQIMVDPELRNCRAEGRWRLIRTPPQAKLMFWRQTRSCEGKGGWRIVVRNGRQME